MKSFMQAAATTHATRMYDEKSTYQDFSEKNADGRSKALDFNVAVFLTFAVYMVFFCFGLSTGVFGPTFVHLEYLYNTGMKQIAVTFAAYNVGILIGNIVCALTFDWVNHELQFAFFGAIAGVGVTLSTFSPNLYIFYIVVGVEFFAIGLIYAAAQVYTIKLWIAYDLHRQAVQGGHFIWCIGHFIAPFIALPFLDELPKVNGVLIPASEWHLLQAEINNTTSINHQSDLNDIGKFDPTKVRYVYIIVGGCIFIKAMMFFLGIILKGDPICTGSESNGSIISSSSFMSSQGLLPDNIISVSEKIKTSRLKVFKLLILTLFFLFTVFHAWHRFVIGNFLTSFAIKGLGWSTDAAAAAPSVFYGAHTLGALFGVLIAKSISPGNLILIDQTMTSLALSLMLLSTIYPTIAWISIIISGFILATVMPSVLLWLIDYMPINSVVGALLISGQSIGAISSGWLVGYLFERYSPMWMVYICIGSSLMCLVIVLVLLGLAFGMTSHVSTSENERLIDSDEDEEPDVEEVVLQTTDFGNVPPTSVFQGFPESFREKQYYDIIAEKSPQPMEYYSFQGLRDSQESRSDTSSSNQEIIKQGLHSESVPRVKSILKVKGMHTCSEEGLPCTNSGTDISKKHIVLNLDKPIVLNDYGSKFDTQQKKVVPFNYTDKELEPSKENISNEENSNFKEHNAENLYKPVVYDGVQNQSNRMYKEDARDDKQLQDSYSQYQDAISINASPRERSVDTEINTVSSNDSLEKESGGISSSTRSSETQTDDETSSIQTQTDEETTPVYTQTDEGNVKDLIYKSYDRLKKAKKHQSISME